jgi:hypothetical protein
MVMSGIDKYLTVKDPSNIAAIATASEQQPRPAAAPAPAAAAPPQEQYELTSQWTLSSATMSVDLPPLLPDGDGYYQKYITGGEEAVWQGGSSDPIYCNNIFEEAIAQTQAAAQAVVGPSNLAGVTAGASYLPGMGAQKGERLHSISSVCSLPSQFNNTLLPQLQIIVHISCVWNSLEH